MISFFLSLIGRAHLFAVDENVHIKPTPFASLCPWWDLSRISQLLIFHFSHLFFMYSHLLFIPSSSSSLFLCFTISDCCPFLLPEWPSWPVSSHRFSYIRLFSRFSKSLTILLSTLNLTLGKPLKYERIDKVLYLGIYSLCFFQIFQTSFRPGSS